MSWGPAVWKEALQRIPGLWSTAGGRSQQCAQPKVKPTLSCISKSMASRSQEVFIPIYICSATVSGSPLWERHWQIGAKPEKAAGIGRSQSTQHPEGMYLFNPPKRRLQSDSFSVFKYIMGDYGETCLLSKIQNEMTKDNDRKGKVVSWDLAKGFKEKILHNENGE